MGGKEVGYHCFLFLLEKAQELNLEVVALFENSSKLNRQEYDLVAVAEQHNIPVFSEMAKLIEQQEVDFIFSIQYHLILTQAMITKAKILAVNLHMAPVPEYRGCNQFSFAIIDEANEFGTTLHRLEAKIDAGDVIAERRFRIPKECFSSELHRLTVDHSIALFKSELKNIVSGHYTLIAQSELAKVRRVGFHSRNEIQNIRVIDDNWTVEKKKRYFRATWFPPFEPPALNVNNKLIPLSLAWYHSL